MLKTSASIEYENAYGKIKSQDVNADNSRGGRGGEIHKRIGHVLRKTTRLNNSIVEGKPG